MTSIRPRENSEHRRKEAFRPEEIRARIPEDASGLFDFLALARTAAAGRQPPPFTCGIVNAKSGLCQENCAFCAQSAHHAVRTPVHVLLPTEAVLRRAEACAAAGIACMGIVTSGTGPDERDFDALCRTIETVRRRVDIRLCASLGILDRDQAERLARAGVTRYHHNLETGRSFYPTVCTTHGYDERTATVRHARDAGMRTCCGGIFGLGEGWDDRIELAEELARLDVDSIPINFLVPVPGTPLGGRERLPVWEALSIIALFRLLHPARDIVVCGGRDTLGRHESLLFAAGANGLMIGDYLTTAGKALADDLAMLADLGMR